MYPSPNHCQRVVFLPSCLLPPTSPIPVIFRFQALCYHILILHISLKERYKVYLTCLVVILFTVADVFIRHIVFHYITYFISATCLSLSLSLIICSAFRKRYAFCSYTYLMSRPLSIDRGPHPLFIIAYRFPTMSNSHNKISSFPSFLPPHFPIPSS